MSSSHRYSRFVGAIALFFCLSAVGQQRFSLKFKVNQSLIIVPVTINGTGPYNFLLDTGNSDMTVDSRLAAALKLPNVGDVKVLAAEGSSLASVVHLNSVGMGRATVQNVNASVMKRFENSSYDDVRGLLGESFLRNFDLLIDNRRHVIEFESGPGPLVNSLTGERTSFLTHGNYQGRSTSQRVVVFAHFRDLGDRELRLLLDSGADRLVLFIRLANLHSKQRQYSLIGTNFDSVTTVDELMVHSVSVGSSNLSNVVITIPSVFPPQDVDGLLPTSLFHSVFICHSGDFVILNPSSPRQSG
jgi:predicted aspartyl protease